MRFLTRAWADLGLDADLLERVEVSGPVPLAARTAVGELAADSVAAASLALGLVAAVRGGAGPQATASVRLDAARVAASFAAERYLRVDGEPVRGFAPLSGFWPAGDGWVRTHANYPHHAAALRRVLDLPADAGDAAVTDAIAASDPHELAERAAAGGAVVAAVRTAAQWAAGEPGRWAAGLPLVRVRPGAVARPPGPPGPRPLHGVRVLDLTRVLAGPVATRALAHAGADVLRVDPPQPAEIAWQHLDTGQGKRSTLLDLTDRHDRDTFDDLLRGAHVLVTGYRPGALDAFGLDDDTLRAEHPGLVVGRVDAWGAGGPWGDRRGFDSIVQAAIGLADLERDRAQHPDGRPGALPAQALDHASGYLLAAGLAATLAGAAAGGPAATVEVSLARTGHELLATADPAAPPATTTVLPDVEPQHGSGPGRRGHEAGPAVACAPPALDVVGVPAAWDTVGHPWGTDRPGWRRREYT